MGQALLIANCMPFLTILPVEQKREGICLRPFQTGLEAEQSAPTTSISQTQERLQKLLTGRGYYDIMWMVKLDG